MDDQDPFNRLAFQWVHALIKSLQYLLRTIVLDGIVHSWAYPWLWPTPCIRELSKSRFRVNVSGTGRSVYSSARDCDCWWWFQNAALCRPTNPANWVASECTAWTKVVQNNQPQQLTFNSNETSGKTNEKKKMLDKISACVIWILVIIHTANFHTLSRSELRYHKLPLLSSR